MSLESIYTITKRASFDIEERVEACMQNLVDDFNKNIRKNLVVDRTPNWCEGSIRVTLNNEYCCRTPDCSDQCGDKLCTNLESCCSGNCVPGEGNCDSDGKRLYRMYILLSFDNVLCAHAVSLTFNSQMTVMEI